VVVLVVEIRMKMAEVVLLSWVIILLIFAARDALGEKVVTATRSRDGDQYWVYSDGRCEERSCSPEAPNVLNGTCEDNSTLRNKCK